MTPPAGIGPRAAGIGPPARRQVLAAARTSANALGRAHLVEPATSHTHPGADTHGNRPMTR